MKKFIKTSFILLGSAALITSCSKNFLNTQPLDKAAAGPTWQDPSLSESFVTNIYNVYHDGLLNQEGQDCFTDNCLYNFGRADIMESNISPSSPGTIINTTEWNEMYARIRACNVALANLSVAPFDKTIIDRLKGESYFLRAHCYNQLIRYYGGVPLVKTAYTLTDADFTVARNTYDECVKSIVSDLDSAKLLLTGKSMAAGRATPEAAMALKSRVLMIYAASDLHDATKAKAKSALLAGYAHYEFLGYTSGTQADRYAAARDAAKAVIDLNKFGYQWGLGAPQSKDDAITSYTNVYLSRGGGEKETILAKYYINASTDDWGAWYVRNNGMNGYHGWTSTEPTQNLVDHYEMMDGSQFSWSNAAQAAAPYEGRDPRFYATVFYDGAKWKPRTTDGATIDPFGELQFGTYETYQMVNGASTKATYFGLDTRNSSLENWNGTRTGYSIRKFSNDNPAIVDMNQKQEIPSIQIRYTEIVFNYIEALLALGDEATARPWLNQIRFRAGMPAFPLTETGATLIAHFQNEKNIEMMGEEQRFYDARRWMITPTFFNEPVRIMLVTGKLKAGKTVTTYRYDKTNYDYTYTVQNIETGVENRKWNDKVYFPPIRLDEMQKNPKLIQNPGY